MSLLRQHGKIYFVECRPLSAVKIGFTGSGPESRLKACQTGCPAPLRLLGSIPGQMFEEQRLHRAFKPLHIRGEWFRNEWKLSDFINYLDERWTRDQFIAALHDVLMQGTWHPESPISQEEYDDTGDWEPFRETIDHAFGPLEDGE